MNTTIGRENLLANSITRSAFRYDDGLPLEVGGAGDDGVIVREATIAVKLVEVGEEALDVVEGVRPAGMPRDEDPLPRRQVGVDLAANVVGAPPQRVDGPLALRRPRQHAQRLDLLQQDANGLFEFQQLSGHVVNEQSMSNVKTRNATSEHRPPFGSLLAFGM